MEVKREGALVVFAARRTSPRKPPTPVSESAAMVRVRCREEEAASVRARRMGQLRYDDAMRREKQRV